MRGPRSVFPWILIVVASPLLVVGWLRSSAQSTGATMGESIGNALAASLQGVLLFGAGVVLLVIGVVVLVFRGLKARWPG